MCGIAGILNYTRQRLKIDETDLVRMAKSISHRGPDGSGVWTDQKKIAGLAHTRLSIIDLSPLGAQPMHSEDNRFHLVYNGEIYNHLKLRHELVRLGHTFSGRSDTETLLHALIEWGPKALARLDGMFAFCFYDSRKKKAMLARDRIGIKPLYYTFQHGILYFASEIKAIFTHPNISPSLDPLACYHYLTFLTTPAPLTMFKGIEKVPAGHAMKISFRTSKRREKIQGVQWWDAVVESPEDARYEDETWVKDEIRRMLGESIEKRMMSDVPFGVFLSGGIDSSTNVALMDTFMTQPVKTFTVGFKDQPGYNEMEHARKISNIFKTEHHEVEIDLDDMSDYLDQLVVTQDEPIADWVCVPLYFVSKLVRDTGTIVVQVGEGSDEQFVGYEGFMEILKWKKKYWDPIRSMPSISKSIPYGLANLMRKFDPKWRGRKEFSHRAWKDRELFWGGAICYPEIFKSEITENRQHWISAVAGKSYESEVDWLPDGFKELDTYGVVKNYMSVIDGKDPSPDFTERMAYLELKLRLPELLLMRVDKITMSTSIEARVPFLDHHMVEFSMNIPQEMKVKNGTPKYILKEAVRGLIPDEIIDRKKQGFDAPVREWLKGSLGEKVEGTFKSTKMREEGLINFDAGIDILNEHRKGVNDLAYPVWSLFNLALWYDKWISGEDSA